MKKSISILLFILVTLFNLDAQVLQPDTMKAQMVKDWERAKAYTADYLNTMPANKYGARAVDSVRIFTLCSN